MQILARTIAVETIAMSDEKPAISTNSMNLPLSQACRVLFVVCLTVSSADSVSGEPVPSDIYFEPVDVDDPVTFMAASEDGLSLALTHQSENSVSIYDVRTGQVVDVLETSSPRTALWRNNRIIVVDSLSGGITVFTQSKKSWKRTREIRMPVSNVVHISAASGSAFKGEVLATAHGPGSSGSYQENGIILVNTNTGKIRAITAPPFSPSLATVSYDGRIVVTQQSFNTSPSGTITAYAWQEFITDSRRARRLFAGGSPSHQTPFVYQVQSGGYLIGREEIFGGVPMSELTGDLSGLVIPDVSQKAVYLLSKGSLNARKLNSTLADIETRIVHFPRTIKDNDELFHQWTHRRNYLLDHPIAVTHEDKTHLFFRPAKGGIILTAETDTFVRTGSKKSRRRTK